MPTEGAGDSSVQPEADSPNPLGDIGTFSTIKIESVGDSVALITLNRPEVANAFNTRWGRTCLMSGLI
jgi:hypothetical protein